MSERRTQGTGSLKEINGKWVGRVRVPGRKNPVKRVVGLARLPGGREGLTKPQAEREWAQIMGELTSAPPPTVGRLTLESAGVRLLTELEIGGKRKTTRQAYESTLRFHLVPYFTGTPPLKSRNKWDGRVNTPRRVGLADITGEDVERYIKSKLGTGRAVKSVFNDVAVLNRVFTFARQKWHLRYNPVEEVTRPRDPNRVDEIRYLKDEEVAAVLRGTADCHRHTPDVRARMLRMTDLRSEGLHWKQIAAALGVAEATVYYYRDHDPDEIDGDRLMMAYLDRALYETAAFTGMRQGELIALRRKDVRFVEEVIVVSRSYKDGEYTMPKNGKARNVPLLDSVARALAIWFDQSPYKADDDLAFAHPETGHPLDDSKLLKRFKATLVRAGVEEHRFHDLRHTYATWLVTIGTDLSEIQELMGHADIKTTMRYARFRPSGDQKERLQKRAEAHAARVHTLGHKLSETGVNSATPNPMNTGDLL